MAYNNNGYGGRANPYAQQQNRYEEPIGGNNYGQAPQYGGSMGRGDYGAENVEMEPLTGTRNNFPQQPQASDPNYILNECVRVDEGITDIQNKLREMDMEQRRSLGQTDASANSPANKAVERLNNDIMAAFRELAGHIKRLKNRPEAGQPRNAPTIGRVTRRLKDMRVQYQNERHQFELAMRDQARRQVLIVKPDATEAEINQFVEDPSNNQIFSQALMQSGRQGQARSALNAVSSRHAEIQKIEQQMIELAELFTEMEALVVQQEVAVTNIEQKGEEVQDNLYKGTEQMEVAITSARARNRKKWWCLGIVVAIIVVVVVVVVIYFLIIKPKNNTTTVVAAPTKRDGIAGMFHQLSSDRAVLPGVEWNPDTKRAVSWEGLKTADSVVIPGVEWSGDAKRSIAPGANFHQLASDRTVLPGVAWTGGDSVLNKRAVVFQG